MARALLFLLVVGTGCVSYQIVPLDEGVVVGAGAGSSGPVRLTLADGRVFRAESVRLDVDSTSWIDPATRALRQVPTVEVAWVDRMQRRKGAVQGAVASFAIATSLTTFYQMVGNQATLGGDFGRDLGTGARVGLLAAPVGAAVGATVSARQRSVFSVGPVYVGPQLAPVPRQAP